MVFNYIGLIEEEGRRSSHHIKWTWRDWGLPYYFCPKTRWKEKDCRLSEDRFNLTSFFLSKDFFLCGFFCWLDSKDLFFFSFLNKEFCVLYFSSARCIKTWRWINVMEQIQRQQLSMSHLFHSPAIFNFKWFLCSVVHVCSFYFVNSL